MASNTSYYPNSITAMPERRVFITKYMLEQTQIIPIRDYFGIPMETTPANSKPFRTGMKIF